jgi:hypothetical protein
LNRKSGRSSFPNTEIVSSTSRTLATALITRIVANMSGRTTNGALGTRPA